MLSSLLPDLRYQPAVEVLLRDGSTGLTGLSDALRWDDPRFLGCAALIGVRLRFPQPVPIRSLRVLFAGTYETDVRNAWVRGLRLPPPGTLSIEGLAAEERRWRVRGEAGIGDGVLIELRVPIQERRDLYLHLPPGPFALLGVAVAAEALVGDAFTGAFVPDLSAYPEGQEALARRGDILGDALLQQGEPSLDALWRLALPYRGSALLGAPITSAKPIDSEAPFSNSAQRSEAPFIDGPIAAVNWDGGIVLPHRDGEADRIWLRLASRAGSPAALPKHGLLEGWLPVSVVHGPGGMDGQWTFIDPEGRLHVRWLGPSRDLDGASRSPAFLAARVVERRAENDRTCVLARAEPLPVSLAEGELRVGGLAGRITAGDGKIDLCLPLHGAPAPRPFDEALLALRGLSTRIIEGGAHLDLPDPRLQDLWRAQLVHNHLFVRGGKMRYGLFPGVYDGDIFGVEEGWNIVAMALYGYGALAQDLLIRTFFDPEFLKKEGQHHQYRNGLALTYALDVFRLTDDRAFLRGLWPIVFDSASWILASLHSTRVEENGQRPPHYGLMPKHTYGGDLHEPAYSLYGSSTCWRGLRDAALIAGILGEDAAAAEFSREAATARGDMNQAAERIYRRDARPPYLPFDVSAPAATPVPTPAAPSDATHDPPAAGDYHQLFSSLVLETALFGWHGPWSQAITDYLLQTGRQVCGVARFDQWFGRLGIDAEYSRGTQLAHLHRRDFDRFYLGLLGQVGLSCDPATFVSPETAIVRFSRRDHQDRMRALSDEPRRYDSDPCSAGTAVMLQSLRYLLLFEERDEDDLPTGVLLCAAGAPRSWFAPGTTFAIASAPTALGRISLRCTSTERSLKYEVTASRPMTVELFYFDAAGTRRSSRQALAGAALSQPIHIQLSRT